MQQEIFGQRSVEIVRYIGNDARDAMLFHELVDCLKPQPATLAMRDQIKDRPAIARDSNGLPFLDLTGKLSEAVFRVADGYGGHGKIVATCGAFVKGQVPWDP